MDNQPIQPTPQAGGIPPLHPNPLTPPSSAPSPTTPPVIRAPQTPAQTPAPNPAPTTTPTPSSAQQPLSTKPTFPTQNSLSSNTSATPQTAPQTNAQTDSLTKKTKKKKIIIAVTCLIILLSGIAFTVFAIIKNQPENIMASAFNNLLSAKNLSIDGDIEISTKNVSMFNNSSATIHISSLHSGPDQSNTAMIQINLGGDTNEQIDMELDNIIVDNGNIYFKIKGVQYPISVAYSLYTALTTLFTDKSSDNSSEIIEKLSSVLEDRWIVISLKDLADNSEYIDSEYVDEYNCLMDKVGDTSNYSTEFTNIYKTNPFLVMQSQPDSFYDISINPDLLAQYINSIPHTNFAQDIALCTNQDIDTNSSSSITASDLKPALESFPRVSAKFDGFLDHRLTELKIFSDNDYVSVNSDLNFNYEAATISAPSDATPIMEIISEITNILQQIPNNYYDYKVDNNIESYNYEDLGTYSTADENYYDNEYFDINSMSEEIQY